VAQSFPPGLIASEAELDVLRIKKELAPALGELSDRVMQHWRMNKEDKRLFQAATAVALAGAGLTAEAVVVGRLVLSKTRAYWLERSLLGHEELVCLRGLDDPELQSLIDHVLLLDQRVRARLGLLDED
jgi:hypothetical protein